MVKGSRRNVRGLSLGLALALLSACAVMLAFVGVPLRRTEAPAPTPPVEVLDAPASPGDDVQPLGSTQLPAGQVDAPAEAQRLAGVAGSGEIPALDEVSSVPDEVLLAIAPDATVEEVEALLASSDAVSAHEVTPEELESGMLQLEVAPGSTVEDALASLSGSQVADAQPNYVYYALDEARPEEELHELLSVDAELEAQDPVAMPLMQGDAEGDDASATPGEEPATEGESDADAPSEEDLLEALRAI